MIPFQERVRGVVFGAALGDALGAVVEKLSYEQIRDMYQRVESLKTEWYKPEEERQGKQRGHGIVTDDTLMMCALIRVYLQEQRHLDAYDLSDGFLREIAFRKTYIPEFGREALLIERLFYPEKTLFTRHALANCEPREGGIGNMVNCGAAMYIAPVGIVNAGDPKGAYDEAILFALGHQCSYGLEAAGVLAACVAKAFEEGATVESVVETAILLAKDGTKQAIAAVTGEAKRLKQCGAGMDEIVSCLQQAMKPFSPMGDDVHRSENKLGVPSNHYTPSRLFSIEELPMALAFIILNDGAFYPSMYDGINSGRDTDSIGVMIGVILGAMHGDRVIRGEDRSLLERANQLQLSILSERFCETAKKIISKDLELHTYRKKYLT
ncbi:ADP-ribosylglycohydrolase family protein [Bacillus sp. FJAT-42376]|uniref:ADP-ribosylglycohydrolase family protein n=1 Tax=Bacillus sp. FJAT-42376 TaxID=2014076 RepID=UPI000F509D54|nr:ADP-ribosylglycohydrolase family protein [Bacillus sp. FJAT-42376]AZB44518.1 ADP-ribosylglycohydrolase family protein [Bacillus sp. FJAT-42376]